jgi:hypothetical protein
MPDEAFAEHEHHINPGSIVQHDWKEVKGRFGNL